MIGARETERKISDKRKKEKNKKLSSHLQTISLFLLEH
jgi:hypothetical protein